MLPLLLWHGFCTAKHTAKFYYLYGVLPPGPSPCAVRESETRLNDTRRRVAFVLAVILFTVLFIQGVSLLAKKSWPNFCKSETECSFPGR